MDELVEARRVAVKKVLGVDAELGNGALERSGQTGKEVVGGLDGVAIGDVGGGDGHRDGDVFVLAVEQTIQNLDAVVRDIIGDVNGQKDGDVVTALVDVVDNSIILPLPTGGIFSKMTS